MLLDVPSLHWIIRHITSAQQLDQFIYIIHAQALVREPYLFHCNFENLDKKRFPSMRDQPSDRNPRSRGPLVAVLI
jgi:hypothetical protein